MGSEPLKFFVLFLTNLAGFRYRAYGDPTVELPWSEVTAISNEVTQYVLKDLNPGDQFEIQVGCTLIEYLNNIFFQLY
jgi:hypothetical protein